MKVNQSYTKKLPRRDDIGRFTKKLTKMCREFEKIFPKEMECKISIANRMIEIRDEQDAAFQHDAMFPADTYMDQPFADSLAETLHDHIGDHLRRRR